MFIVPSRFHYIAGLVTLSTVHSTDWGRYIPPMDRELALHRLAAASGCDGLVDGWARRLANGQPVHAGAVTRDEGPFYCASCHAEVILRRGSERVDHFSHEASRSSPGGAESALHRACK